MAKAALNATTNTKWEKTHLKNMFAFARSVCKEGKCLKMFLNGQFAFNFYIKCEMFSADRCLLWVKIRISLK